MNNADGANHDGGNPRNNLAQMQQRVAAFEQQILRDPALQDPARLQRLAQLQQQLAQRQQHQDRVEQLQQALAQQERDQALQELEREIQEFPLGELRRVEMQRVANQDEPPPVPILPIESLEQWLQVHALPARVDAEERWERTHDRQRIAEATAYQQDVHNRAFGAQDAQEQAQKQQQLQAWQGKRLTLICGQEEERLQVDLVPMAASCDFIFALACRWPHFCVDNEDEDDNNDKMETTDKDFSSVRVRVPQFAVQHVQQFVDICTKQKTLDSLSSGSDIVDMCRVAHYFQNAVMLDETVQILLHSIDTANCLAMTQLADQLHLPRLFEAALAHMMQSVHNLEEGECWDHLSTELQQRITAIRSAIQSSIHDQRSSLYFGSLQEYLAIFAERVHYYKERLEEATEQQADKEQTPAWFDAQRKIERQRLRLHTLQVAFQEQKKLFGREVF